MALRAVLRSLLGLSRFQFSRPSFRERLTPRAGPSETRTEASEALRGLVNAIVLTPDQGELRIELKGNLAAMLGAATNAKRWLFLTQCFDGCYPRRAQRRKP
jgi:hypothetical protein